MAKKRKIIKVSTETCPSLDRSGNRERQDRVLRAGPVPLGPRTLPHKPADAGIRTRGSEGL